MKRRMSIAAAGMLFIGWMTFVGAGSSGNTAWAGNYFVSPLGATVHNPQVMVTWGTATTANLYCWTGTGTPDPTQQSKWLMRWTGAHPSSTMFTLTCDTTAILAASGSQPAVSDLSVMGGVPSTPTATAIPATNTVIPSTAISTSTSTPTSPSTSTTVAPTNTSVPATATTIPTATPTAMPGMEGMTDGGNTCGNLSDDPNARDQNGVPLNRWAPGLRIGCGFAGFENGDDPNPPGSHLPVPRPFDFDNAVVHGESAFGFKVYYRKGSEAPAGYQGTGGCGDVRVILHQGGSVHGFTTQYHTVQIAMDQCDAQGNHHILDIAGRINTGVLDQRQNPDSQRAQVDRLTATTLSCDGRSTFICATVWYSAFDYQVPGGSWTAWHHFGFLVENPITNYDPACPTCIHLTGNDGTTTMLRDHQYSVPPRSAVSDWWTLFNPETGVNEVVPAGTVGAWQMHVDTWYDDVTKLEPAYGVDHPHPIGGIRYPN